MTQTRNHRRISLYLLVSSAVGMVVCFAFASARLRGLLINSSLLAGGAVLVSVPLGTLLALGVTKTSLPGRGFIKWLMIGLIFVPLYVQAAAWQAAWGHNGWLLPSGAGSSWFDSWFAAIWVHGVAAIPWVVLIVGAALVSTPRQFEEESLQDATSWRVLFRVSLRRALAAVVAAGLWIVVICFGEITVTDLYRVRTFAEEIYTAASLGMLNDPTMGMVAGNSGWEEVPHLAQRDLWLGTAAVMMLVLAALAAAWFYLSDIDIISSSEQWSWRPHRSRIAIALAAWCLIAVIVGAPIVGLLGKAGMQVRRVGVSTNREWSAQKAVTMVLSSPWEHRRELGWSGAIGGVAAVGATMFGVVIAWSLRTGWLPAWPTAMLLAIGFAIPGPLLGVWLIRLLNHPHDSIFSFLTWCYDHTILAPALAQFLRALPLTTLVLWTQLANVSQDVLDSATSEGAGWWRRLVSIALPQRWPAVVAAACMALIIAFGDLAATLLVAPPGVSTASVRIFGLLHYGSEDQVSALCLAMAAGLGFVATTAAMLLQTGKQGK